MTWSTQTVRGAAFFLVEEARSNLGRRAHPAEILVNILEEHGPRIGGPNGWPAAVMLACYRQLFPIYEHIA